MKTLVVVIALVFMLALSISRTFEITPEGIKRESEIEVDKSITRHTGQKIVAPTVVLSVIATGLLAFQLWGPKSSSGKALMLCG